MRQIKTQPIHCFRAGWYYKASLLICHCLIYMTLSNGVLASEPLEDTHYKLVEQVNVNHPYVQNEEPIIEFFSFGCYHCYKFEKEIQSWDNKYQRALKKVPVSFGRKEWEKLARLYLVLDHVSLSKQTTKKVFSEIHENGNRDIDLNDLIVRLGLNEEEESTIIRLLNSRIIDAKVEEAEEIAKKYKVAGVPAVLIDGRYFSDSGMARGTSGLSKVASFLLEKNP